MSKHILFVGHEASRTGAPIFLLHLLRWMSVQQGYTCELLLLTGGELEAEYRSIATCTVLRSNRSPVPALASLRILKKFCRVALLCFDRIRAFFRVWSLRRRWKRSGIDLLYLNTIVSGNALRFFRDLPAPVILHVHELSLGITWGITAAALDKVREKSTAIIAASEAVKRLLTDAYGFTSSSISVVYEAIGPQEQGVQKISGIRSQLGIDDGDIVVGMCGTVEWRKGLDLFIQLAKSVSRTSSGKRVHFLWVGGETPEIMFTSIALRFHLSSEELTRIHFVGAKSDTESYFAAMDIFALTSREDPFPLAHIEAARSGLPILCFRSAGGAEEWVGEGAGFIVPFGDSAAMAEKVRFLADDASLRASMGAYACRTVLERFTIGTIGSQVLRLLESVLTHPGRV